MVMDFQKGDRVVLISKEVERDYGFPVGTAGVVHHIDAFGDIGVIFDISSAGGHDLGQYDVPYGRGLWVGKRHVIHEMTNDFMDDISSDELMEILK